MKPSSFLLFMILLFGFICLVELDFFGKADDVEVPDLPIYEIGANTQDEFRKIADEIVKGYTDEDGNLIGLYGPEKPITRAAPYKMMVSGDGLPCDAGCNGCDECTDTNDPVTPEQLEKIMIFKEALELVDSFTPAQRNKKLREFRDRLIKKGKKNE